MRRPILLLAANILAVMLLTVCMGSSALAASQSPLSSLPSPWSSQDIGVVGTPGNSSVSNGVYTVAGSGSDIWYASDHFQYAYEPLSGDGQLSALVATQVSAVGPSDQWAKAGIMIRASTLANSAYAFVTITPGYGITFQTRATAGALSTQQVVGPAVTVPYYLKLVRQGNSFTAFASIDGATWVSVGSPVTIVMPSAVEMGLAVTSHKDGVLSTATFSSLNGGSTVTPPPTTTSLMPTGPIGLTNLSTSSNGPAAYGSSGSSPATNATDDDFTTAWTNAIGDTAPSLTVNLTAPVPAGNTTTPAQTVHGALIYWGSGSSTPRTYSIQVCSDTAGTLPTGPGPVGASPARLCSSTTTVPATYVPGPGSTTGSAPALPTAWTTVGTPITSSNNIDFIAFPTGTAGNSIRIAGVAGSYYAVDEFEVF
jgi:hypothetical protein